ncbi:Patatin-like phospholipase domain-containing protein [Candida tropicalis]
MSEKRIPLFEEDKDYINEDHISEFAKALIWQDDYDYDNSTTTPTNESKNFDTSINDDKEETKTESELAEEALNIGGNETIVPIDTDITQHDEDNNSLSTNNKRPVLITSKSDWFPIQSDSPSSSSSSNKTQPSTSSNKSKKSKKKSTLKVLQNEFRNSSSYTLLRWPILIFVFIWIGILGFLYFLIRVYVALSEYFFTWTGKRKKLRDKLRNSSTYEEWIENAIELDKYLNLDKWSENPKFSYYDYKTVKLTITRLNKLRNENGKILDLMVVLQGCLKKNFAGIENRQLYSHRYYGTKKLVEEYYKEVILCIEKVTEDNTVPLDLKKKFFRIVSKNFGKSALCLSGGACFAYTHFGIAKALLDQDLLPNIISGTSGGGLIASLLCVRTNEELKKLLVPQLARKITACEDPWYVWLPRFIRTGARFDAVSWARKSNFFTKGSTTFEEAFKLTGRKLNISTIPADPHSPVILCNDITSPHCIIWSTLLASSAVPGILNPVVLMMKNPANGQVIPFSLGSKWRDGSLRTDIPVEALNTYYNVNFTIVSQVNPHISLFYFAPKGTVGRPVSTSKRKTSREKYASFRGGFIATALEQLFRLEIKKWLQIIKSLDLLPHFLQQDWSNIWLQNFSGTITIWPRNRLIDFWYILSDPTEKRMAEIIKKGERCMFPRLLFIKHRSSIERAIEKGKKLTILNYKQAHKSYNEAEDDDVTDSDYDYDDNSITEYDSKMFKRSVGLSKDEKEMLAHFGDDEDDESEEEDEDEFEEDVDSDAFNPGFVDHERHRRNTIF